MLSCGERNLNRRRPRSDQIAFAIRSDAVRHPLWFCLKTKSASTDTNIRTNRRRLLIHCCYAQKHNLLGKQVVNRFYQTCVSDNQCQAKRIETSQRIVEHTPPASVYMSVYPTATKRLGDVDDTEEDKSNCSKRYCYI